MLLRSKKTQGEDQNWCVILSPIASELDRKKVAQKISGVFALSFEEAQDLVSNTPIIILDNLTRTIAAQLKDYFRASGAEIILTNDVFQKRKCYRTVWPEQPNLAFLHGSASAASAKNDSEAMPPEEALDEIRTLSNPTVDEKMPSLTSIPFMNRNEREQLAEEAERWRRECLKLREEIKDLKEHQEQHKESMLSDFTQQQHDTEWYEEKEKEIKESQLLLEHANEKYEALRQEYANARQLYEDKITGLIQEADQTKRRITEISESLGLLQNENKQLQQRVEEKESGLRNSIEAALDEKQALERKLAAVTQESEQQKRKVTELSESLRGFQRDKQLLQESLAHKERDIQTLGEETRKVRALYEQRLLKAQEETGIMEARLREVQGKLELLQKSKEELELTINTQSEQIIHWKDRYDQQVPKLMQLEREIANEKTLREAYENRQTELETSQSRLNQELEVKAAQLKDVESKFSELNRQFFELKEAYENQEKAFLYQQKQLEIRERELDAARRQIRDINVQNEQRESIQKKTQLANQLIEKESLLKKLVKDQEKIETEIREREESIRSILTQQETVEKEIIEAKQAQRHLLEQSKRDQKGPRKFGVHAPEENLTEGE